MNNESNPPPLLFFFFQLVFLSYFIHIYCFFAFYSTPCASTLPGILVRAIFLSLFLFFSGVFFFGQPARADRSLCLAASNRCCCCKLSATGCRSANQATSRSAAPGIWPSSWFSCGSMFGKLPQVSWVGVPGSTGRCSPPVRIKYARRPSAYTSVDCVGGVGGPARSSGAKVSSETLSKPSFNGTPQSVS